jgi:tetratricopeptide (TPR) repeat protein
MRALMAMLVMPGVACALRSPAMAGMGRRSAIGLLVGTPTLLAASPSAMSASPTREGMRAFSEGKVEQSITIFDKIVTEQPTLKPYLWQRGLSLYYADRFEDGAEQFKVDVSVNPNDTEEAIWYFMCVARLEGFDAAQQKLLRVGEDRRPVMRAALRLFQGANDESPLQTFASSSNSGDYFYSNLYLGLWREAQGDATGSRRFIKAAADSPYAKSSGDYMADLARVHVQRRGW